MRQSFPCGHRGRGQYCHRCRQEQDTTQAREAVREDRRDLADLLGVAISEFPERILRRAAAMVRQVLADGLPALRALGAKKILSADGVLSVPIGHRYRLLFAVEQDRARYLALLSHSDYNARIERL